MATAQTSPNAPSQAMSPARSADVRLEDLTKEFDDVVAVDGISLTIESGQFFALLGPSGCGKTTTLRMIGGFEEPTAGSIYLGDRDVVGLPPYKRNVNTVFQSYALFPHLSIFENVAFGMRRQGVKGTQLAGRVREILQLVDLPGLENRKPRQLSGGQQQRVALARALVNKPDEVRHEIKNLQQQLGITTVHVTHDRQEAMVMADRIVILDGGRVAQIGAPEEIYNHPTSPFVASFLGISNLLMGTVTGADTVRLDEGTEVRVPGEALNGRTGRVAVGVRPEKIRLGHAEENRLTGRLLETAYVGVATQYVLETRAGNVSVYVQNSEPGARNHAPSEISWSPDSTFVVDSTEEVE